MTNDYKISRISKNEISVSGSGVGGLSIIMIFAVLCLTVFATLTLISSKSEFNLALGYKESIKNYYKADYEASKFTAVLQSAKSINDIQIIADNNDASFETLTTADGGTYYYINYNITIDEKQKLTVRYKITPHISEGVSINILEWIPVYTDEWSSDIGFNLLNP